MARSVTIPFFLNRCRCGAIGNYSLFFIVAAAVGRWDLHHFGPHNFDSTCLLSSLRLLATLGAAQTSQFTAASAVYYYFIIFISILTALAVCGLLRRWCSSQFVVALAFRRSAQLRTRLCEYTFSPLLLWPLAVQHNFELAIASIIL